MFLTMGSKRVAGVPVTLLEPIFEVRGRLSEISVERVGDCKGIACFPVFSRVGVTCCQMTSQLCLAGCTVVIYVRQEIGLKMAVYVEEG